MVSSLFPVRRSYQNGLSFHQAELSNHYIDYIPQSREKLIITFEGSEPKHKMDAWQRPPWGGAALIRQGHSVLAVKHKQADWYRAKDLHMFFRSPAFQDVLKAHGQVYLYGSSMGGYAALAFSAAVPGAHVLACCPQSTMDPQRVPFDKRFPVASRQKWNGFFADAAESMTKEGRIYVAFDPFYPPDYYHVERLPKDKIVSLKAPFFQHDILKPLIDLGLIQEMVVQFLNGTLEEWFPKALRKRKTHHIYAATAHFHCALRHYRMGEKEAAEQYLQQSLGAFPSCQVSLLLAECMKQGRAFNWPDFALKKPGSL
ncbi:MAG TPA: hypothetical protein PLO23_07040 [Alphaproteobacteria bacterium]|nr:hypothetical protein [Alphaproteobacteria bacterium]